MKDTNKHEEDNYIYERYSAFHAIGDRCRLSVVTVRNAFSRKPITWATALKLSRLLGIPIECFRLKQDKRGVNKNGTATQDKDGE